MTKMKALLAGFLALFLTAGARADGLREKAPAKAAPLVRVRMFLSTESAGKNQVKSSIEALKKLGFKPSGKAFPADAAQKAVKNADGSRYKVYGLMPETAIPQALAQQIGGVESISLHDSRVGKRLQRILGPPTNFDGDRKRRAFGWNSPALAAGPQAAPIASQDKPLSSAIIRVQPIRKTGATLPAPGQALVLAQPDSGVAPILDYLKSAKKSIDLIIYEFTDPDIITALTNAASGSLKVPVRVLYNDKSFQNRPGGSPNAPTVAALQKVKGIRTKPAPATFAVTHQKTFIIDGASAIIMDFNLALNYFTKTRGFAYVTSEIDLVREIAAVFQADWDGKTASPSQPRLIWSPENSRSKITDAIKGAKKSIYLYNQELKDQATLDVIAAKAKAGIPVYVISPNLRGSGPGVDGNQAGRDFLTKAGVHNKIGLEALYMHSKAMVIDDVQGIIESENLSDFSLDKNRELGVFITDPTQVAVVKATFMKDWNSLK